MSGGDRMIDQHEAAVLLGLRPRTLESWRLETRHALAKGKPGRGPKWRRIGRRVRYLESEVLAFRDADVCGGEAA